MGCDCFRGGNKLLLCGNGGSASDADHIAGELMKGFKLARKLRPADRERLPDDVADNLQRGLPAIPLTNFAATASAFHNDCNGEYLFAQLVSVLGTEGDVLVCLSTSGNSPNILHATAVARAKGLRVLGFTGEGGGKMARQADICLCAPSHETYRIQEYHLPLYHALCLAWEETFFGEQADM